MRLKELLDDHQTGHSEFQDDYFITIRAGGTIYGQYKQALRELYRRFRGLRELVCSRAKLEIEIERERKKSGALDDGYEKALADVECTRKTLLLEEANRVIKDTEREFGRFYSQACWLKDMVGELTPKRRKELEVELWEYRVKEMIVVDLVTKGRIGPTAYELLGVLPRESKMHVMHELRNNQGGLIEWYEARSDSREFSNDVPEIDLDSITLLDQL